jgi:hypothetical protein
MGDISINSSIMKEGHSTTCLKAAGRDVVWVDVEIQI